MIHSTPEQQQRLQLIIARNKVAWNEASVMMQKLNNTAQEMMHDGQVDEGLDLCDKGLSRLEGLSMTLRRMIDDA